MRGLIYAVSPEGALGQDGRIPWRHPGDQRRFKRITMGTTVVMGRRTFESLGKPLAGRRNLVVTTHPERVLAKGAMNGALSCARSVGEALAQAEHEKPGGDVWFIGGTGIYAEAMALADCIDVTYVPDHVTGPNVTFAPPVDEALFEGGPLLAHEDEPGLTRRVYTRRKAG